METKHRNNILSNLEQLTRLTNYTDLITECVNEGILSEVMRNNIDNMDIKSDEPLTENERTERKHIRLFEKITMRGPKAYSSLKQLLVQLECHDAVKVLNESIIDDSQFVSITKKKGERFYHNKVNENEPEFDTNVLTPKIDLKVKMSDTIMTDPLVKTYPMKSKDNRGILFMVNNIEFRDEKKKTRNGAEEDSKLLVHIFNQLNFKLITHKNLKKLEFFEELRKVLDSNAAKQTECFIMALMSHSDGEDVEFSDLEKANLSEITEYFSSVNSENLIGKPKILILPFCRGSESDKGVAISTSNNVQTDSMKENQNSTIVHTFSDLILCYACSKGFMAHRDAQYGSWYVQTLCKVIAEHAHNVCFIKLLQLTEQDTSNIRASQGQMQSATYTNIAFKTFYFNPGIYEENGVVKRFEEPTNEQETACKTD